MTAGPPETTRRRGRRPAGADTRAALLDAARTIFVEQGFDGATVRAIAGRAGVDAAMVNHWFGSKEGLFAAAMELPIDPAALVDSLIAGGIDGIGERIVRRFLGVWDSNRGGPLIGLVRSVSSHDASATMVREFVTSVLIGRLVRGLRLDEPELRTALCGSQIIGLAMTRYVIKLEPIASAGPDTLAAAIGPTLQRYLTGPIETLPIDTRPIDTRPIDTRPIETRPDAGLTGPTGLSGPPRSPR